jgi:hypothetical protein
VKKVYYGRKPHKAPNFRVLDSEKSKKGKIKNRQ